MKKKKNSAASRLGRLGGKASAAAMTPKQRSEKARRAVMARWAKQRKVVK